MNPTPLGSLNAGQEEFQLGVERVRELQELIAAVYTSVNNEGDSR